VVGTDIKGYVGALCPLLLDEIGIDKPTFAFEICIEDLEYSEGERYIPVSRFPSVRRDINIVIDAHVSADSLRDVVWESACETLTELQLLDVYQGQGIDSLKKSITLGLIFRHNSRTLTDSETGNACKNILSAIEKQLGGVLRD
jgi:phenylalanyl-tRNA synthetase beta chain